MKLTNRLFLIAFLAPLAVWLLCIGAVVYLSTVAACTVHEGFANPCQAFGLDLADTAYSLGVFAAWGPLIVGPVMFGIGAVWLAVVLVARLATRRRH